MKLYDTVNIAVKFSEVDSLQIVWHGHYVRYLEDVRESFGTKYTLHYLDIYQNGYITPIVEVQIEYKKPLKYGDSFSITIFYDPCDAAKIIFKYEIRELKTQVLVAKAKTVQVFLNHENNELEITNPEFYLIWKEKNGLI